MTNLTPAQIDRALTIGERIVDLAAAIWGKAKKAAPTARKPKTRP